MASPIVRPCVIKSFQGESPGPASEISYTVTISFEYSTLDVAGVIPNNERWPDIYDVRAVKVGTAIVCHDFGDAGFQFYMDERPDVTVCGEPP